MSFGLLTKADFDRAIAVDPNMPRTRAKLAVPFVGKDVPSQSSEYVPLSPFLAQGLADVFSLARRFAHPDVILGLTVLAYRYEGLRWSDFNDIIANLRSTLTLEVGPYSERKSSIRYAQWVKMAGGKVRGSLNFQTIGKDKDKMEEETQTEEDDSLEVVPLRLLKRSNEEQMQKLHSILFKLPDLIHWYLNEFIFPAYMRHQVRPHSSPARHVFLLLGLWIHRCSLH